MPKDRYRAETARLYGVLDRQLAQNEFVAGDFISIADFSIWGWASLWEGQQQTLEETNRTWRVGWTRWAHAEAYRQVVPYTPSCESKTALVFLSAFIRFNHIRLEARELPK